ncbi:MAG: hypothetical protein HYT11_00900, partial [Candidatus Levybacteria bacterium]|nr:hypothetical protein [Candidatus Levybacteria bacterium]
MKLEIERPEVIETFFMTDNTILESEEISLPQEEGSVFREAPPKWLSETLRPSESIHNSTGIQIINTRLWLADLNERSEYKNKGRITIDNVPKAEWKRLFDKYDIFYFMGIYEPSEASREYCLKHIESFQHALPKENPEQFLGPSPFANADYELNPQIAPGATSEERWQKFEKMADYLHSHGKKIIVDFIGNHFGLDNRWLEDRDEQGNLVGPDYFVHGGDYQYVEPETGKVHWLSHGSDPYFGPWHDTLLLNYGNPKVHKKMEGVLQRLVDHHIDGVRCDMAHLQLRRRFKEMHDNKLSDEQKAFIDQGGLWERRDTDGNTII